MKTCKLVFKKGKRDTVLIRVEADSKQWQPRVQASTLSASEPMRKMGWSFTGSETQDGLLIWSFRRPETDLERLQVALETHDWTFQYSESLGVWQNGWAQEKHIQDLVARLGAEGQALYEQFTTQFA